MIKLQVTEAITEIGFINISEYHLAATDLFVAYKSEFFILIVTLLS
jgi:hypothetical protein